MERRGTILKYCTCDMKELVTISREFGSGGRIIGEILAKKLDVPFYDRALIDAAAKESGFCPEIIENAELKAKSGFAYNLSSALYFYDNLGAGGLSVNEQLFLAQFQVIKDIDRTKGGVIVGRCADYILRDVPKVTNVFIYGEFEDRLKRVIQVYGEDEDKAKELINTYDKARQNYYNYHTGQKWGEFKNYNLAINSSYITEEKAAELILEYVKTRK